MSTLPCKTHSFKRCVNARHDAQTRIVDFLNADFSARWLPTQRLRSNLRWCCLFRCTAASPSFAPAPEDEKVVEGHDVTLTCRVYGAPRPQLEWKHDSTPVSGPRFVVHDSGDLEILVNFPQLHCKKYPYIHGSFVASFPVLVAPLARCES